jgi:hypothetical protein
MLYFFNAAGKTLKHGSPIETRKLLKISTVPPLSVDDKSVFSCWLEIWCLEVPDCFERVVDGGIVWGEGLLGRTENGT